jgi:hypothetical protein
MQPDQRSCIRESEFPHDHQQLFELNRFPRAKATLPLIQPIEQLQSHRLSAYQYRWSIIACGNVVLLANARHGQCFRRRAQPTAIHQDKGS